MTREWARDELDELVADPTHPVHSVAAAVLYHPGVGDWTAQRVRGLIRDVCRAVLEGRPDLAAPPPEIPPSARLSAVPWNTYEDAFVHGYTQGNARACESIADAVRQLPDGADFDGTVAAVVHELTRSAPGRAVRWLEAAAAR